MHCPLSLCTIQVHAPPTAIENVHYRYREVATKKERERTVKEISILSLCETATIFFIDSRGREVTISHSLRKPMVPGPTSPTF